MAIDEREQRGMLIAAKCRITKQGNGYSVPSASQDGTKYLVFPHGEKACCSCPDFQTRQMKCKHMWAVSYVIEREENEEKDKANIRADMEKAAQRIRIIEHELAKLNVQKAQTAVDASDGSDDDDEDDFDERGGFESELQQLKQANTDRQAKLDEYEKNKKWNVDNMFEVKEERTVVNPNAGKESYTDSGFAVEKTGGLDAARLIEPVGMLNIRFGYGLGRGTAIAPSWLIVAA